VYSLQMWPWAASHMAHGPQVGDPCCKPLTINLSRLQVLELLNTVMEILHDCFGLHQL